MRLVETDLLKNFFGLSNLFILLKAASKRTHKASV